MVSVFDLAQYILKKQGDTGIRKLQKFCCYSQAWHAARTGRRMVREKFEAWSNGPVCPQLSRVCSGKYTIRAVDPESGNAKRLNSNERESADVVLASYGDKLPYELREIPVFEEPWIRAWESVPNEATERAEITIESMAKYYGSL